MFRKRLITTIILVLIFAASFIAGYFTLYKNASKNIKPLENSSSINDVSAKTVNSATDSILVTQNTKIKIIYNYLVDNNIITDKVDGTSNLKNIIGMTENEVKKYYDTMKYKVINFSSDEITIESSEVINSWPPNSFVVKSDAGEIVIYTVDSQGKLSQPERTMIRLDTLRPEEKESFIKGKVYHKREEVEELIGDYTS